MKAIGKTRFVEAVRTWDGTQVADTLRERPEFASLLDDAGRTLLHHCARRRISDENNSAASIATANVLLKAGVPINAVEPIRDDGEVFPATALWYALAWGRNRAARVVSLAFKATRGSAVTLAGRNGCGARLAPRSVASWTWTRESPLPRRAHVIGAHRAPNETSQPGRSIAAEGDE